MSKVMVGKNTLIVIILAACLVCCAVSVGISALVVNSGVNTVTGEKGDAGAAGATGSTGATGPTGATGTTGATGSTGPAGTSGSNGATWYSGAGQPTATIGATGDYYLDTTANAIYRKDAVGTWIKQTNLQLNNKAGYDSGWVSLNSLAGQNFTFAHNLNTTNLQIQIQGKDASGNIHQKYLGLSSNTVQGWNQTISETDNYIGLSMTATSDGGYIISGIKIKNLYSSEANVFLLKIDDYGYEDWCQTYDLSYYDESYAVVQTSDDGYAVTGYSAPFNGNGYAFLMKTDSAGTMEWNTTLGEIESIGDTIVQTSDGGYAIVGQKDAEVCMIKTYGNGTLQWINTYGGNTGHAVIQTSDNGYAIVGSEYGSNDINHGYLVKVNANGAMQWNKTIGANSTQQYCYSVSSTSDGGYILAGNSYPDSSYLTAVYLAKTSADGTLEWNKTYVGEDSQYGVSVLEATSGGYVVGGYAYVSTEENQVDYLLLKTAADGTLQWNNTYNNVQYDRARMMVAASDGGYAMVGYSMNEDDTNYRTFVVKTLSNGTLDWSQTYGGSSRQYAYSAVATSDGGYAITGYTRPSVSYRTDVYLIKTAADGTLSWTKAYDLGVESRGYSVIQTSDGGYAISGIADSMVVLLKADVNGTLLWSKTFNLTDSDAYGYSVRQTSDGGYAIAGYAYEDTVNYTSDICLIKTDKNGALQWNYTYGGSGNQMAYSMVLTPNGEYVIAGSYNTDGISSAMLLKVDANGVEKWMKVYNTTDDSYGQSLVATPDGGYAIAGYAYMDSTYTADVYLIKTDANGTMQWNQTYGGAGYDYGYSIVTTPEGGYAIGGYTESLVSYSYDFMLVKVSSNGTLQWTKTWDGGDSERARALVASKDGSFVLVGYNSAYQVILYKATVTLEQGLANVATTNNTITVYRGLDDNYWQYVRIQIWRAD
jgi:hypothetical protein